jgi:hypothetical protein
MRRFDLIKQIAAVVLVGAGLALSGGCYSKVVDGKGIGADSRTLRKNHEFGSERPIQDFVTTEQQRRQR